MIAKLVKGRGFRGALEYDLTKEKGRVIDSNMAGQTPRALATEFGEIRKLRPNLGKAVLHVSLSAAPGETLTDAQWREIGQRYLHGMGFTDNQFVLTRHTDTEHEHVHIVANRITHAGEVVSDGQDYKRQEALMRDIERDYSLQRVAPSIEAERKAPTKGEIEQGLRTGQPSVRQQLQQLCDAAAKDCGSFTAYQARLEAAGVELVPVAQLGGAKLSGLSYRLDGVTMKGSDLGKGYTAAGIQKRGVSYEQDRDFAAVRRCVERDAARAFGEPDRGPATGQAAERGGPGRDAGTVGASDGGADGRDAADTGRDRPQEPGTRRDIPAPAGGVGDGLHGRGSGGGESRRASGPGRGADGVDTLHAGGGDRDAYSHARDRILALAAATGDQERTGPARGGRAPEARRDRSLEALQRQVTALGVARVEVGIREAKTGQMMNREWSVAELMQSATWLKRMNAKGNDVYLRPAGEHGLVLVDDLTPQALERMQAEGFAPAATIETSPGNYQAWVKLSDQPLAADVRRLAAQELAKQYGGDPNSADSRHYGRLAGFTNQKPGHTREGRQPYVLAHDCSGKVPAAALEALQRIESHLDRIRCKEVRKTRLEALKAAQPGYGGHDPVREYQRQAQRLMQRYGAEADFSRLDWMIATDMAKSGRFTAQDIARGIRECSPHVESRKAGHIEDYARRTAEKAWHAPEVQQHRQAQEASRQVKRERDGPGWSR